MALDDGEDAAGSHCQGEGHQAAGSENVIDLHGRLDIVRCMGCERRTPRGEHQVEFDRRNPEWIDLQAADAPDGDADLEGRDFASFDVPTCASCGGILKPDVVFFGESVLGDRRDAARRHVAQADAMLIVGSSLMVRDRDLLTTVATPAGQVPRTVHRSLDCSIMDVADDIAYGVHDVEDGLTLGMIDETAFRLHVPLDTASPVRDAVGRRIRRL